MYKYQVVSSQKISPSTLLLTLRAANGSKPINFIPGQYATIQFTRKGRPTPVRCFSIVTSPNDHNSLQFSMRVKGRYTKALSELRTNDDVTVQGPFGGFVFEEQYDKDVVFLAGGIGITPFMSMIRYANQLQLPNRISLVFSNQKQDDVPFSEEILRHDRENPNFNATFVVSDGPTNRIPQNNVLAGRLTPEILPRILGSNFANKTYFVCGPPGFMKAMIKMLTKSGVPENYIITEAFSQTTKRQSELLKSWPFNMYALTALGVVAATFLVTVGDLVSTLPSKAAASNLNSNSTTTPTNSRQDQINNALNNTTTLNTDNNTATPTSASLNNSSSNSASNSSAANNTNNYQPVSRQS